ncbi:ABC transporter transmembrane domain-containing protein [Mesotoga sp.]|uniref:ABC transporter transmembrane domain-containing protein n=1 Tax=Mesotoga sp. TaxID=2053577 RepID=UPI001BD3D70D|nr:ABC transporter transmembrane domain-containing protein [Mesotoga sp.]
MLISWRLSLIFLVIIPLVTYLTFAIMKRVLPLFSRVQQEMDNVNTRIRDNSSGIRVVKSLASAEFESSKFNGANESYTATAMKAARTMVIIMPLLSLILNLGIVAVIWFGGIQVEA